MDASHTYPKLRWPIDLRLHDAAGKRVLVLQCPLGISEKPLVLVPAVGPILSLFDGSRSREQILAQFGPQGLTEKTLTELILLLDQHLFLANGKFFAAGQEAREAFERADVRSPALAGRAYPAEAAQLKGLVDSCLVEAPASEANDAEVACLVAPHIDYQRGGRCYGVTYPELRRSSSDLFVLMGTAHQYSAGIFHLCAKDFESPLGKLPCDTDFMTKLAARYGVERSFKEQFLHKREHSLELQLPFVSSLKPGASIAPILVGSLHRAVVEQRAPQEIDEYESLVGALCEVLLEREAAGRKVCFIAGVDMAHVGKSFGDEDSLTLQKMEKVAARDREYLSAIERLDASALFTHICEDGDARRICGFPTMYTILDLFSRLNRRPAVKLISYDQAVDYPGECAVTFAGMAMFERESQKN